MVAAAFGFAQIFVVVVVVVDYLSVTAANHDSEAVLIMMMTWR